jgi:thiol-disulfide isomerase/thioredoxin
LAAAVVVSVVALVAWRVGEQRGLTAAAAGTAAAYALVPLSARKLIGVVVAAVGFDHWLLPHHAVDSLVVVVNRAVDPVRFASKLAVNWLPPLLVLVAAIRSTLRRHNEPAVRAMTLATRVGAGALVLLVAVATITTIVDVSARAERLRPVVRGDALPDVQLPRLNAPEAPRALGKKLRLSDLRGQVVVLDFWASWCTPCRRSIPELSALATELGPQGLVVVGINREGDLKSAQEAWAEIGARFDSLVDVSDYGGRLGVSSLPTSYVVDRQGVVRHLHLGYVEPAVVRAELSQLLAEPPPATP